MKLSDFLFVLVGASFLLLGIFRFEELTEVIEFSVFSWLLLSFLLIDLRYWYVPQGLAIFSLCMGLAFGLINVVPGFGDRIQGVLWGFLFLWCVLITSTWTLRRLNMLGASEFAMGSGDPLLLAVIGGFVGYLGLPGVLFLASLQGILAYLLIRALKDVAFRPPWQDAHRHAVPFGAFMCLAALELIIWPDLVRDLVAFVHRML